MRFAASDVTISADDPRAAFEEVVGLVVRGAEPYRARLCIDGSPERGTFTNGYLAVATACRDAHEARHGARICYHDDEHSCFLALASDIRGRLA